MGISFLDWKAGAYRLYISFHKNVSLIIDKETFSLASLVYVREGPEIRITLPENWKTARSITLESPDRKYIGTVFNIDNFLKIDGFVEATETYLKGWARYRSEPERPVKLHITAQSPQKHTSDRSALYRPIKITTCPTKLFDIKNLSGEACLPLLLSSEQHFFFRKKLVCHNRNRCSIIRQPFALQHFSRTSSFICACKPRNLPGTL